MSNPSFSNIDRWLFELMEGNLSPEQIAQLEAFLLKHPELDVDRDMWELSKIQEQEVEYPHRQQLMKRRPVGLYMSLGFASMALMVGLGFYSFFGDFSDLTQSGLSYADSNLSAGEHEQLTIPSVNKQHKSGSIGSQAGNTNGSFSTQNNNQDAIVASNMPFAAVSPFDGMNINPLNGNNAADGMLAQNLPEGLNDQTIWNSNAIYKNEKVLKTQKAKELNYSRKERAILYSSVNAGPGQRFEKTEYKLSFSAKLSRMGRKVQRMLDNPVALKNMKDPHYHVPGMQATDINFGSVGTLLSTRFQTLSRAQWLGENNQQFTNRLMIDGYSYGMRGGFGFQFDHNYYGDGMIQNYTAALIYSPKFSVSRNIVVEPSVRFKMGTKNLDWDKVNNGEEVEYDRMNTHSFAAGFGEPVGNQLWYKDLGLGLMVNTKWFFIGVQGDNLFQHYDNIYQYDPQNPRRAGKHYVATIGTDYQSSRENLTLSPYAVFQQQEKLSEGWLGFNMKYHWITLGGAISSNLEPAASLGVKLDRFMITYNADYTQSDMLQKSALSHQLSIRFLSKPSRVGQRLLNQ